MTDKYTITPQALGIPNTIPLPKRTDWRIGLVGFGEIAPAHVQAYQTVGWNIVAIADPDLRAQERARERLGRVKLYHDYQELVRDDDVEVIALLTQPTLRAPVIAAAAETRKPILTEKPLGTSLDECERMVTLAEKAGIPFAVSQNYRWMPANFFAKQIIDRGLIGTPFHASIEIYGQQDTQVANHPYYSTCADFLTIEWNTHLADLLRYWMSKDARRVLTCTRRSQGQRFVSDNLMISIADFGEGFTGHIVHSELVQSSMGKSQCRIDSDQGSIEFGLYTSELRLESKELGGPPLNLAQADLFPSMCGAMGDLLLSIEEQREPLVSGRRNLGTIRHVFAERESGRAGGVWIAL
jgi:predicted dehydrogenase